MPRDDGHDASASDYAAADEASASVARHAHALAAAETWTEIYVVLCAIPDELLEAVADNDNQAHSTLFARAAVATRIRAGGLLEAELASPAHPALSIVLEDLEAQFDTRAADLVEPATLLCAECAAVADRLTPRARLAASALALKVITPLADPAADAMVERLTAARFDDRRDEQARQMLRAAHAILRTAGDAASPNADAWTTTEPDAEIHARALAAAESPLEAYLVLTAIPPALLKPVAERLSHTSDGPPGAIPFTALLAELASAPADSGVRIGCPALGFAIIEWEKPEMPVLGALLQELSRNLTSAATVPAGRLCIECALLVDLLRPPARLTASALALSLYGRGGAWDDQLSRAIDTLMATPFDAPEDEAARRALVGRHQVARRAQSRGFKFDAALDEGEVARYARELDASTSWLSAYQVLHTIPDNLLRPVAEQLGGLALVRGTEWRDGQAAVRWDEEMNTFALLAWASAAGGGNRVAGFVALEGHGGDTFPLQGLIQETQAALRSSPRDGLVHGLLLAKDCAALADELAPECRLAAARFAIGLYQHDRAEFLSRLIRALTECAYDDAVHERERHDLVATHHMLRFETLGIRSDLIEGLKHGSEAVHRLTSEDPRAAAYHDNHAIRLFTAWQRHQTEKILLERAVAHGAQALELLPPDADAPDSVLYCINHHSILSVFWRVTRDRAHLEAALASIERAVDLTSTGDPMRSRALANLALGLGDHFDAYGSPDNTAALDRAVELAEAAYADPSGYDVSRARLLWQIGELRWKRFRLRGDEADRKRVVDLADEWMAAARNGDRIGVLTAASFWVTTLFEVAVSTAVPWDKAAVCGEFALGRATRLADLPELPIAAEMERDAHAISARRAIDGVLALTVLASARAGDLGRTILVLEEGAAATGRQLASRIPWEFALERQPGLAETALRLQARLAADDASGHARQDAEAAHAAAVGQLRKAMTIPNVAPAAPVTLANRATGPLVWIIATPYGGLAVRLDRQRATKRELSGVTSATALAWHEALRAVQRDDTAGRAYARRGLPERPSLPMVCRVMDEMRTAFADIADWLDEAGACLIPAGHLAGLPWQAIHSRLRLNVSATQATSARPERAGGAFAVFADTRGDLSGARAEADALRSRHEATISCGASATLAELGALSDVRTLHLALHGTRAPAIWFADGPLSLTTIYPYRDVFKGLDQLVLNCCTSGAAHPDLVDETLSIPAVALALGTSNVLVALWTVDDAPACTFGVAYHDHLVHGGEPVSALAHARELTRERHPDSATAYAYQLLG